ncbi:MAG: class I mannose-6-phosphate isomerase [Clostridia bacterium]|nr:class I mannose-6-phosphate isomerase [Clostridia bacterium]
MGNWCDYKVTTDEKIYPLLLKPVIKDYLWGGTRLIDEYGFETDKNPAAEGWMLSCHKDGTNIVVNGEYKGKSLDEVLKNWYGDYSLPILIKLIDAKDRLSVQVHPDNEYALKNEGEPGKTEMWYIVDCEPGAELIYGFTKEVSKDEFAERINKNTLDAVMNYVPVKKGDVFFIKSGTLHAIGKGILIAEIQQNSNTTYRVSDYGRLGADGKPRELHVKKALDVTETRPSTIPYGNIGEIEKHSFGIKRHLAKCEYFDVTYYDLSGKVDLTSNDCFSSLLVIEGKIDIEYNNGTVSAGKGDSLFIPKGLKVTVSGTAKIILSEF